MTPLPDDEVLQQAAEWFAVLNDENLSTREHQQWQTWLQADPCHQQAWDQVCQIAGSFDNVSHEASRRAASEVLANERPHTYRNLIALCAVCLTTGLSWLAVSPYSLLTGGYHYRTAIGETEQIRLEDGTELWLNTDTDVVTHYDNNLRRIVLKRGEVLVDTAPDPHKTYRRLVVDTDNGRLTALGTRFSVRYHNNDTGLTVFEGAVRIEPEMTGDRATVPAGQQGRFSQNAIQQKKGQADPAREAWVHGILMTENLPLCQFMAELDRYRHGETLCPSSLNSLRLTGTYPLANTDAILTAVESSLPVTIRQIDDQLWRIEKNN